jgi:S-formylglutathione hydrolase
MDLDSAVMERSVPVSVLLPPGFDPDKTTGLPLVIQLHGGGSSRNQLVGEQPWIDELFADGTLPPVVFVMFSTSAFSGFLGPWEEFISSELPAWVSEHYSTREDREGVVIAGISMGGYGALKSAFRTPERFLAVGAMEPSIEPTLTTLPNFTRNSWSRGPAESLAPSDKPARIAHDNAAAIRDSGLEIYLEVGDEDFINLHDGAEFLHRVLWDHDIRHEYHLVRWADHVGGSMKGRYREMHAFLAKALAGGRHDPVALPITDDEMKLLEATGAKIQAGEPPPPEYWDYMNGDRGPTFNANFWNPLRELAKGDPELARAYAKLPPTTLPEDDQEPAMEQ